MSTHALPDPGYDGRPTLFFAVPGVRTAGETVSVTGSEAAHARTLRLRPGDAVALVDGRGARWLGEVASIGRRELDVRLARAVEGIPAGRVELWVPVGNRDRIGWLVEKAVELGVSRIRLIECERSRSVADGGRSSGAVERYRSRAVAALKQSGAGHLPAIDDPVDLDVALADPGPEVRWLGDTGGAPSVVLVAAEPRSCVWMVGPEGGLTEPEKVRLREDGFRPVALGPRTLRFETAALAGLVLLELGRPAAAAAQDTAAAGAQDTAAAGAQDTAAPDAPEEGGRT